MTGPVAGTAESFGVANLLGSALDWCFAEGAWALPLDEAWSVLPETTGSRPVDLVIGAAGFAATVHLAVRDSERQPCPAYPARRLPRRPLRPLDRR